MVSNKRIVKEICLPNSTAFPHWAASSISSRRVHPLLDVPGGPRATAALMPLRDGTSSSQCRGAAGPGSPQGGREVPTGRQGRAWQPAPVPPPRPGAKQARGGPSPGHLAPPRGQSEAGPGRGRALHLAGPGRAVWSWRPAPLRRHCGRDRWPQARGLGPVGAVGACRPWRTPWCTGEGLWGSHSRGMAPTSRLRSSEVSFASLLSIPFPRLCLGSVSSVPFPPSRPSPCASYTLGGFFHSCEVNPSLPLLHTCAGRQQELP